MNRTVLAVTQRIIERSRRTRAAYLARLEQSAARERRRHRLSCGNLAHVAAACPERDVIQVTGDGRSVEIICYWPHRLAWIGDSLVVSTMDRDVLIFRDLTGAVCPERP